MKYIISMFIISLVAVSSATLAQTINWTVTVQKIQISDETAKVLVHGTTSPNPSSSVWNCTSNLVSLGDYSNPVPVTLKYSTAMEAYRSGATARIGVEGSGTDCRLTYITINPKM